MSKWEMKRGRKRRKKERGERERDKERGERKRKTREEKERKRRERERRKKRMEKGRDVISSYMAAFIISRLPEINVQSPLLSTVV